MQREELWEGKPLQGGRCLERSEGVPQFEYGIRDLSIIRRHTKAP